GAGRFVAVSLTSRYAQAEFQQTREADKSRAQCIRVLAERIEDPGEHAVTRFKSWILTDVLNDVWLDSFAVGNDSLRVATPHDWSIRKRTLHGGLRDGVDLIEVHNGALSFSVLPTRGMSLWRGEYRGNFLGWRSPVLGPVHPRHVHLGDFGGLGWLT